MLRTSSDSSKTLSGYAIIMPLDPNEHRFEFLETRMLLVYLMLSSTVSSILENLYTVTVSSHSDSIYELAIDHMDPSFLVHRETTPLCMFT